VTTKLKAGARKKAMNRLRVPPLGEQVRFSQSLSCTERFRYNAVLRTQGEIRVLDSILGAHLNILWTIAPAV